MSGGAIASGKGDDIVALGWIHLPNMEVQSEVTGSVQLQAPQKISERGEHLFDQTR